MKKFVPASLAVKASAFAAFSMWLVSAASALNIPAVQLINKSSQNARTVLNGGAPFTTNFRATDDVVITLLTGTLNSIYNDNYGGSTPGNNPDYVTGFVGTSATGTGNGTKGEFSLLETNLTGTNVSLRYDFAQPLTAADRILIADVDNDEQYQIQAYTLVNGVYKLASLTGWRHEAFSGQTGTAPTAKWPTWNAAAGTLTSNAGGKLNEPLDVLTPDQSVSRIVFTKLAGSNASAVIQVIEVPSSDFFAGEVALANGVYYLQFSSGNPFGYYSYLSDRHYIYHFDLGYEYIFDAADGKSGVYLYDFKSNTFFYSNPAFPFPYLYDFTLNSVVYYYPDPNNAGRYNTNGVRYFYVFKTGQIISK